ncbi:hypothetical protein J437_LFUL013315, partial [Ladona fulva]
MPCRTGPQTTHSRVNIEQNKNCLIQISRYRFSLVISGLTKILQKVNEMFPKQPGPDFERNFYDSLVIVMDTLEKCLSGQPNDTNRLDETMNVKLLLREICQFIETIQKFRLLKKSAHLVLIASLEKATWNWMDTYPNEFAELQIKPNENLSKCCEALFDILDGCGDNRKVRLVTWPLQIMLLLLSPKVLEEIVNADMGAPCSPRHSKKKHFIDSIKRAVGPHGTNKYTEAAALTCVKLCKASTYISNLDPNNVAFTLVQSVINDLKLKNLASKVLFALSLNFFGAVFNRISARLQELSACNDENPDYSDIELIQHINVDVNGLTKLLS